ncbi:YjzD family protein [Lysinibacillus pakistanensis]|uniref:YjzD family protein n=1 Tax=Lysinibacillus TaxID=400634 RepID=UPI00257AC713|nr:MULTISPECIES: YjzD family protein [Lysinibacillus]
MQYIITFIWSFILVSMLNYVVSSVLGAPFDFKSGAIVSVVFSILIFIIGAILPNEPTPEATDHH